MKNLKIDKTINRIKRKQLEESIISDKNVNTDIKESARKVKNSKEARAVAQETKKKRQK